MKKTRRQLRRLVFYRLEFIAEAARRSAADNTHSGQSKLPVAFSHIPGRLHGSVLFTNSLNTSFVIKCV